MPNSIIFDLDDTLYKEVDYVKSGFNAVAGYISEKENLNQKDLYGSLIEHFEQGGNTFENLIDTYGLSYSIFELLEVYRTHTPKLDLDSNTNDLLNNLKKDSAYLGLLTDGRSNQQRNKIKALGLNKYFNGIVISEEFGSKKPSEKNFKYFMKIANEKYKYYYIGDNTKKDFIAPNKLGWETICLRDNGLNIHQQKFNLDSSFLPKYMINNLAEIVKIVNDE